MADLEGVECAKCSQPPDDILILTCDHNLCLECAAKNLHREEMKSKHTFQTVVCDICGVSTVLDPSSANELMSLHPAEKGTNIRENLDQRPTATAGNDTLGQNPRDYSRNYEYGSNVAASNQYNSHVRDSPGYAMSGGNGPSSYAQRSGAMRSPMYDDPSMMSNAGRMRESCREHPEEEVQYYCFDCEIGCICAECVIHGAHRNHEVLNIRKAYPMIKAKVEDLMLQVNAKIDESRINEQRLETRKRELIENTSSIKQEMSKAFEELRQRVDKKERELMSNADIFLDENLRELDSYIRVSNTNVARLEDQGDEIRKNLAQKDEVRLLNFYPNKKERMLSRDNNNENPQINDIPKLCNMKCYLNTQSVTEHIDALHGLHLQIAALRGAEDGNPSGHKPQSAIHRSPRAEYSSDDYRSSGHGSHTRYNQTGGY